MYNLTDKKSPNIRINKVYTRAGDAGKTRLIGSEERWKDDARVEEVRRAKAALDPEM